MVRGPGVSFSWRGNGDEADVVDCGADVRRDGGVCADGGRAGVRRGGDPAERNNGRQLPAISAGRAVW